MIQEFETIFTSLKEILQHYADGFSIKASDGYYCLYAPVGPATIKAWGGKMKKPIMPVGWVETGKSYVSYHLMGMYGNTVLQNSLSKELKERMQGKTCFNFKANNETLFTELDQLTKKSIEGFKKAGFIV